MKVLGFLSNEQLDECLSIGLNCAMKLMKMKWPDRWRSLEWFMYYPCVCLLVEEYKIRHTRIKIKRKK